MILIFATLLIITTEGQRILPSHEKQTEENFGSPELTVEDGFSTNCTDYEEQVKISSRSTKICGSNQKSYVLYSFTVHNDHFVTYLFTITTKSRQRSLETRINLLYSIYPDRKHRFGIEKKWTLQSIFGWGDIVQIS
jgi:hypothetical protein